MVEVKRRKRREVGGSKSYKAWKEWSVGDRVVGEFTGQSTDNYDKPNWHIKVEEIDMQEPIDSRGGAIVVGSTLGLNSNGSLDFKMQDVEVGELLEITYEGMTVLPDNHKFKGKDSHQIKLEVILDEGEEDEDEEEVEL